MDGRRNRRQTAGFLHARPQAAQGAQFGDAEKFVRVDRDAGEMEVDWSNGQFYSGPGSLHGYFEEQIAPGSPETDAWRANSGSSGGAFTGDYWTDIGNFSGWRFQFYADDVLPSDLTIRFYDGVNWFSRAVGSQVTGLDNWFTVNVPLTYGGWFGGSATDFSNALGNVTFIDVQITRNGTPEQHFYMDNFELYYDPLAGTIPEPATGLFWFGAVLLYGLRRHMNRGQAIG